MTGKIGIAYAEQARSRGGRHMMAALMARLLEVAVIIGLLVRAAVLVSNVCVVPAMTLMGVAHRRCAVMSAVGCTGELMYCRSRALQGHHEQQEHE